MLMESKKTWKITWILIYMFLLIRYVQGINSYDPDSLDSYLHDYAVEEMAKPITGTLYNVSLPSNFSGIEVSVLRIRSRRLWLKGVNNSFFNIPPRIFPWPFVKRIDVFYQNLGNWSGNYYKVPNYTLVAPVIGLFVYDSNLSHVTEYGKLELVINGDPIQVHFPRIEKNVDKNVTMKCVRFDKNGTFEFSNLNKTNTCITHGQGHFSIAIPTPSSRSSPSPSRKKKTKIWKWWVIGFGVGIIGLLLLFFIIFFICKIVRVNKIGKMERQSEKSEALDTIWIGRSRMPSATSIRTQPVLENGYVP